MCEKCNQIDEKIAHYETLKSRISDKFTLDGIVKIITELAAEKARLHPEVHLVHVRTDDGTIQIWLAATDRNHAVARVLDAIPEGWTASLVDRRLSASHAAALDMQPGDVRHHQVS